MASSSLRWSPPSVRPRGRLNASLPPRYLPGGDRFVGTTYIQRVNTVGGVKPPSEACSVSTLNTRRLVSYEADYYFYR